MEKSIKSISTGTGSPLIMNEDMIMKNMSHFGYALSDVWNVGTSACWEPLIIGKSFDQNNPLPSVNLIEILTKIIMQSDSPASLDVILTQFKRKSKKR